jgi:ADP-L-glycero-D-manno-heptose 6-epimerase
MGATGFIGANLVKVLNERGETDVLAVDNIARSEKCRNLPDSEGS